MASKTYMAVIRHDGTPSTLEVIASGSKAHCVGALAGWKSVKGALGAAGEPLIVVEVAE